MRDSFSKSPGFITRWVLAVAYFVMTRVTSWLKRHDKNNFEKWKYSQGEFRSQGMAQLKSVQYEPTSKEGLENRYHSGSSVDTSRLRIALPDWAKEIPPFLANQLSEHTRRAYETDLKQFFTFLEGRIDAKDLGRLRPDGPGWLFGRAGSPLPGAQRGAAW